MNKKELVDEISKRHGIPTRMVQTIISQLAHVLREGLDRDSKVSFRGFGTFHLATVRKRYYNRFTHSIEERRITNKVKFRPSRSFKLLVNPQRVIGAKLTAPSSVHQSRFHTNTREGAVNLGQRIENVDIDNPLTIEYKGEVSIDCFLGTSEHRLYPSLKTPMIGTPILCPQIIRNGAISGVTEPLLLRELKKLCSQNNNLVIIYNAAIPIEGWERPYIPDFVLHHKEANLYIDIEIDEPYDIVTRTPIHYIGNNDINRDNYLISNGWVVIRYSEHQVYKHLSDVINDLYGKICWLTGNHRNSSILQIENRWTYSEAEEMAKKKVREDYLDIHAIRTNVVTENFANEPSYQYSIPQHTIRHLPNTQTKTEYIVLKQIDYTFSIKPKYIRITLKDSRQFIVNGESAYTEPNTDGEVFISGIYSCITQEYRKKWDIKQIDRIEPLSCLYTNYHWIKGQTGYDCRGILINAALSGSPIWIKYKSFRSEIKERLINCLYLSDHKPNSRPEPRNKPSISAPFTNMGTIVHKTYEITKAHCCFYINGWQFGFWDNRADTDILEIKVINSRNTFYDANVYLNSLNEVILHPNNYRWNFFLNVDYILSKISDIEKKHWVYDKLLAHYMTIKGKFTQALEYYISKEYRRLVAYKDTTHNWGDLCTKEIQNFIDMFIKEKDYNSQSDNDLSPSKLVENFIKIKSMLIEYGWKWE